jgi:hypothetical protein
MVAPGAGLSGTAHGIVADSGRWRIDGRDAVRVKAYPTFMPPSPKTVLPCE